MQNQLQEISYVIADNEEKKVKVIPVDFSYDLFYNEL